MRPIKLIELTVFGKPCGKVGHISDARLSVKLLDIGATSPMAAVVVLPPESDPVQAIRGFAFLQAAALKATASRVGTTA